MPIYHDWRATNLTSPSGKAMHRCADCRLLDVAPVKPEYEDRLCAGMDYDPCYDIDGSIVRYNGRPPRDITPQSTRGVPLPAAFVDAKGAQEKERADRG